jgi:GT2 family glycosyltransferase
MNQHESQLLPQVPIELAVIINSFNRLSLLRQALPSITQALELLTLKSVVIVFDAGSTDGSVEFIKNFSTHSQKPQIIYICASADMDRSFSAGCNFAVEFAAQRYPQIKWCLFFETDNLIVNELALPLAVKLLEQEEELAGVGFTVESCDGQKSPFGCRFPTPLAFCLGRQLSRRLRLEQTQINNWYSFDGVRWGVSDVVYTSPILLRYSAWQATGGMDAAKFPFSDCDVDWCWTVYKKGLHVAVLDIPGVIHDNRMQKSEWSANRAINFHRARLRLLLKHVGQWVALLKPILFIRHCLEVFLLTFGSLHFERAKKSLPQCKILINTVFNRYET